MASVRRLRRDASTASAWWSVAIRSGDPKKEKITVNRIADVVVVSVVVTWIALAGIVLAAVVWSMVPERWRLKR